MKELLALVERREKLFLLDVRNRDEFAKVPLQRREPLLATNAPYFELLELGGQKEMVDSVVACVEQHLAGQIPRDLLVLGVCARGDTSEYVAQGLHRLGYFSSNLKGGMKACGESCSTRTVIESPELAIYQCAMPQASEASKGERT